MAIASAQEDSRENLFKPNVELNKSIDKGFTGLTLFAGFLTASVLFAIVFSVFIQALPALGKFGLGFLFNGTWDPVQEQFGAAVQVYGTLVCSLLSMLVAIPFGWGVAIFLSEDFDLVPKQLFDPLTRSKISKNIRFYLTIIVELLAAIPSVVFGIWGLNAFIPTTRPFQNWLFSSFNWFPLFSTAPPGPSMLTAGLVLGIMVTPIVIAISREVLTAVPRDLRQGALALGATRWEALFGVVLPAALGGMMGAVVLALGRAMGETMAAAMLIGNSRRFSVSLLSPASNIPALVANEFSEANDVQRSALLYAALLLLVITLLVNIAAEIIITKVTERITASKAR